MKLPPIICQAITRDLPVEQDGLTLYPVRVYEHTEFMFGSLSIGLMQQAFPVRLLSLPYMTALYKLDIEQETQYTLSLLAMLALSLQVGQGLPLDARMKKFKLHVANDDPTTLKFISYLHDGMEERHITPIMFSRLRPIIAAQNGIELVGDDENPELVEAERDIAVAKSPNLKVDFDDLKSGIACLEGIEEHEIDDWTIRKLYRRKKAHERIMSYKMCGLAEMNGTKWKSGNPVPSPFYERTLQTNSLISADTFAGGAAKQSIYGG